MRRLTKLNKYEWTALIVAFVVMVAALMYVPTNGYDFDDEESSGIILKGTVVGEDGEPLADALITLYQSNIWDDGPCTVNIMTSTDANGSFSLDLDEETITIPGRATCTASMSEHWSHQINITMSEDDEMIDLDFLLADDAAYVLPTGPFVLASTLDGQTRVDISTYLEEISRMRYHFNGSYNVSTGIDPYTLDISSSNGSLTYTGMEAGMTGIYYGTTDDGYKIGSYWTNIYYQGIAFDDVTLDADYLDPETVEKDSIFYSLELGENVTVTTEPDHDVTLPQELCSEASCTPLGNVSIEMICSYSYGFLSYVNDVPVMINPDAESYASVTIAPLTEGVHTYQVYIEDSFIIHVWEV
jgi:hypothetical protein